MWQAVESEGLCGTASAPVHNPVHIRGRTKMTSKDQRFVLSTETTCRRKLDHKKPLTWTNVKLQQARQAMTVLCEGEYICQSQDLR